MIWKIAKKEFLLNLMTFKFAVGTVLCVVLVAVFVPVLADDYQQRLQRYSQQVMDNEAKLRQVKAYRVLTPTIYRRPQDQPKQRFRFPVPLHEFRGEKVQ